MKRWGVVAAGVVVLGTGAVFLFGGRKAPGVYQTVPVDRGDVLDVVGATGGLEAVTTVQVGSQVSGTIASLHADFNSVVHKGEVIARLDPSLFQARLEQARANLVSARAGVERSRAALDDARQKFDRAHELAGQNLLPASDLETARSNDQSAEAQLKASQAAVAQAEASVHQAEVDLDHTVIRAPIDGVVIGRNVDVGQTVAASLQAPTLFVIAEDLTRMRVKAAVDEADIGRVRDGQDVSFRVDAYPDESFTGRVEQVRLQPTTVQNVVTYDVLIAVDNPELRLMPGMTATVSIVVRKAPGVLRIPVAALRFRPEGVEAPTFAAAGSGPTDSARGAAGPGRGRRGAGERPARGRTGEASRAAPRREAGGGRPATVYVLQNGRPVATPVRLGLSDGVHTEVRSGLEEGAPVVTGIAEGPVAQSEPSATRNPFQPQFRRRQR